MPFQRRPAARAEFHDGNLAARHGLLVAQIFVRRDHDLEAGLFRGGQQRPVFQPVPSQSLRVLDIVAWQQIGEIVRKVLVQQHPQAGAGERRRRCFLCAS